MAATEISSPYLVVEQGNQRFYLTNLTAKDVVHISYVARRGETTEQGAVQRLLSPKRIASISDYAIEVGIFPSCIILNWVNTDYPIRPKARELVLPRRRQSAQIIDGQHRVAGLEEAIQKKKAIGNLQIPVAIYDGLDTRSCADIFLSINTEQKPVPKSLVFDLYGDASQFIVDAAAVRAKDIAEALQSNEESPYYNFIKFPGSHRNSKGIQLSTIVSAVKPLVEDQGAFEQVGMVELQTQEQVLFNYFWVLQECYGDKWEDPKNALRTAAGFTGAVEFFRLKMLSYCNLQHDFSQACMASVFHLDESELIYKDELAGLQGRKAYQTVAEWLERGFRPKSKAKAEFRV